MVEYPSFDGNITSEYQGIIQEDRRTDHSFTALGMHLLTLLKVRLIAE